MGNPFAIGAKNIPLPTCQILHTMKNDKPGSKSGPKKDFKPDYKSKNRPDSKPESRSGAGNYKDAKGEDKSGPRSGSFSPKLGSKNAPAKRTETRKAGGDAKTERAPTQAFPPKRYINVYLSLGSNMGNRAANLRDAAAMIDKNIGKIAKKSHVYETEPWGETRQDPFLNQVLMINTTLDPRDMLEIITHIEKELGRVKTEKWGPRPIDIDILFYGKRVIRDKGLDIPHPELHNRGFVLVPLMEIAPELEHPVLKQPIDELYMACKDPSEVVMLEG